MGIVPRVRLTSNDPRMAGVYCQKKCIDERRAGLPPFIDPNARWNRVEEVENVPENVPERPEFVPEPTVIDDGKSQGFDLLFG